MQTTNIGIHDNPLITLVVPVYNVEKYIDKAIQSIEKQDYKNLEVILIDDGSTDNSGIICDNYCNNNHNFFVIHQKNAGLSAARNVGVSKANGDYISFVDSDDIISKDYVSYLVKLLQKYDADMSIARLRKTKKQMIIEDDTELEERLLTPSQALEMMCYGYDFSVTAVAKLYKKKYLLNNPYPKGKLYEDLATTYKIIDGCKRIAYGTKQIYFYCQRSDSIMNCKLDEKQLYGLVAADEQLSFIKANYPEITEAAKFHCVVKIMDYMNQLLNPSDENKAWYRQLRNRLALYDDKLMCNKKIMVTSKIKYMAMKMGYGCARMTFLAINKTK